MTEHSDRDADQVVRESVEKALSFGQRVFGDGGIAKQIVAGEWDGRFTDVTARDAAARWDALGEHIRAVRADAAVDLWDHEPRREWLCGLPLNRKERYYTGTVLPGLGRVGKRIRGAAPSDLGYDSAAGNH